MQYVKLGNTGAEVSRICLGCMSFGAPGREHGDFPWARDFDDARSIFKKAVDLGINYFDTANVYQYGTSEEITGRLIREFGLDRDDIVVATKVRFDMRKGRPNGGGLSRKEIMAEIDKSLKRLGMDYVDLYICHMWDYQTHIYDILDGMNRMVKAGKVRYIGIANCYAWQLAKANTLAEKEGFAKFVSVQNHYNLLFREEEREMAGLCEVDNIAMTPYSALASGRLSRKPGESTKRLAEDKVAMSKYDGMASADEKIIARVAELANRYQVSMTEISLAWLATKVDAPVVGATKLHHVEGAVKSLELVLADEDKNYLEELYVPHPLVGVMAQNTKNAKKEEQPWMKNALKA